MMMVVVVTSMDQTIMMKCRWFSGSRAPISISRIGSGCKGDIVIIIIIII
jgi:hypothetical protein